MTLHCKDDISDSLCRGQIIPADTVTGGRSKIFHAYFSPSENKLEYLYLSKR